MKKVVIILTSLALLLMSCGCGTKSTTKKTEKKETKKNEQSSNIFLSNQTIGDLSFKNFAITKDTMTNNYVIFFNIVNNGVAEYNISKIKMTLYSDDVEVLSLDIDVDKKLKKGETVDVVENIDVALKDIDKVEYIVE